MFQKMRTGSLLAVVSLAVAAVGCTVESSSNDGKLRLSWSIQDSTGQASSCAAAGAATVRLTVVPGGNFDFACSAGSNETTPLPAGNYTVSVSLLDTAGNVLAATTNGGPYTVVHGATTNIGNVVLVTGGAPPVNGSLYLTWSIQTASGPSTCAAVGASTVQFVVYGDSGSAAQTFEFPCAGGEGETAGLPSDSYWAMVRLYDASGNVLSETTATGPYWVTEDTSTDIGDILFQVSTDQFFYVNWVIHKCADTNCTYDLPGNQQCPSGSTVVITVDGTAYQAVDCNETAAQTTSLTPGNHNISIQLLGCGGTCSLFPGSGTYPITIQQGVPYGAALIFAIR